MWHYLDAGSVGVATLQATQANWQGQYNQPTEGQWLETFPLPWTSQAGSRWLDVTWQVDNTTGDSWALCPADLLGSEESPSSESIEVSSPFPELCLLCHCPQCSDHCCWEKVKTEPDMLLLGAEQLARITSVFQVSQLVTNMIPQTSDYSFMTRIWDYHIIVRFFFLFPSTKKHHRSSVYLL